MSELETNARFEEIRRTVAAYYSSRINQYGPTAAGVDWNSDASQSLRFEQLLRVDDGVGRSINDYGCGYGALASYLRATGRDWGYRGFDISDDMIARAIGEHRDDGSTFTTDASAVAPADFTVASGIFNVRLRHTDELWQDYVLETLRALQSISLRGFAFNMLSTYSDVDRRRGDLFYADPLFMFDYCKRNLSPRVSLLHDYPLYEFTIIVRA